MRIPQIRLQSTFTRIGLQIDKPVQKIEQPKAIQTIEQPKAKLEIETIPAKLNIDQSQLRADLGFKTIPQLVREFQAEGRQAGLEGTARRAQQGDELMKIENKGNPIPQQASQNAYKPEKQLAIGWIPSANSVKIHYQPADVQIKATPQKPIIDAKIQKPTHEYTPGKVSAYLEQKNSLKIDFVNLFDETI